MSTQVKVAPLHHSVVAEGLAHQVVREKPQQSYVSVKNILYFSNRDRNLDVRMTCEHALKGLGNVWCTLDSPEGLQWLRENRVTLVTPGRCCFRPKVTQHRVDFDTVIVDVMGSGEATFQEILDSINTMAVSGRRVNVYGVRHLLNDSADISRVRDTGITVFNLPFTKTSLDVLRRGSVTRDITLMVHEKRRAVGVIESKVSGAMTPVTLLLRDTPSPSSPIGKRPSGTPVPVLAPPTEGLVAIVDDQIKPSGARQSVAISRAGDRICSPLPEPIGCTLVTDGLTPTSMFLEIRIMVLVNTVAKIQQACKVLKKMGQVCCVATADDALCAMTGRRFCCLTCPHMEEEVAAEHAPTEFDVGLVDFNLEGLARGSTIFESGAHVARQIREAQIRLLEGGGYPFQPAPLLTYTEQYSRHDDTLNVEHAIFTCADKTQVLFQGIIPPRATVATVHKILSRVLKRSIPRVVSVMILEDDTTNRRMADRIFSRMGCDVCAVASSEDGLFAMTQRSFKCLSCMTRVDTRPVEHEPRDFDVALLDFNLSAWPPIKGLETGPDVARAIRKFEIEQASVSGCEMVSARLLTNSSDYSHTTDVLPHNLIEIRIGEQTVTLFDGVLPKPTTLDIARSVLENMLKFTALPETLWVEL